jgi:putative ABC transport system permease protein
LRSALALFGIAVSVAVLSCLAAYGSGYEKSLHRELNSMGLQMMLVPLGCPYDGAARVLKGQALDTSLPQSALAKVRLDPAVAIAAPLLTVAVPRPQQGRTDLWVGLDEAALALKPWWKVQAGARWFPNQNSVILGAEAAATEDRAVGDKFFSPETGRTFTVSGVLQRSGTSDDSLFFVPLTTAQTMFNQPQRLTGIAIRLHDPLQLREAVDRLQNIEGAQVVTMTEMLGTFLNLVAAMRALLFGIAATAVTISALGAFNTLLAATIERTDELAMLRALGAARTQVFALVTLESLLMGLVGSALGLAIGALLGRPLEALARSFVPLSPAQSLLHLSAPVVVQSTLVGVGAALVAGLYPAWRASQLAPGAALKTD